MNGTTYKWKWSGKLIFSILLAGIAIGCWGCQQKPAKRFSYHLTLCMSEKIVDTDRILNFHFSSNNFKEKAGFKLISQVVTDLKAHNLQINLSTTVMSPPSNAPLATTAPIDNLEEGTYNLRIRFKDDLIGGKLVINRQSYHLKLTDNPAIKVDKDRLNKLPLHAIFGTIHYYSAEDLPSINHFFSELKGLGATEQLYNPGYYHLFSIGNDGQIVQQQDKGYPYTQSFIYQYTGNQQALKSLVKKWSFSHSSELLITLNTFDGQLYNIWSFGK